MYGPFHFRSLRGTAGEIQSYQETLAQDPEALLCAAIGPLLDERVISYAILDPTSLLGAEDEIYTAFKLTIAKETEIQATKISKAQLVIQALKQRFSKPEQQPDEYTVVRLCAASDQPASELLIKRTRDGYSLANGIQDSTGEAGEVIKATMTYTDRIAALKRLHEFLPTSRVAISENLPPDPHPTHTITGLNSETYTMRTHLYQLFRAFELGDSYEIQLTPRVTNADSCNRLLCVNLASKIDQTRSVEIMSAFFYTRQIPYVLDDAPANLELTVSKVIASAGTLDIIGFRYITADSQGPVELDAVQREELYSIIKTYVTPDNLVQHPAD